MSTPLFAALLVIGLQPQTPDSKSSTSATFSDPYLGLEFVYPKNWTVIKKTREMTRYSMPIEGSPSGAELEIIRSSFHSTKEIWQTIQLRANETLHRDVIRQWEQDVIHVPMLATQIGFSDHGSAKTTLTGLYYTRTPMKMLVRLTASAGDFDKAKYSFDQALESLRTTNGTAPIEDDPNVVFTETKKPVPQPEKPLVIDAGAAAKTVTLRRQLSVPLTVSTKNLTLKIPAGWTATDVSEGKLKLTHQRLGNPLFVEVHYALDSDKTSLALTRLEGAELPEFQAGLLREDTDPTINEVGCSVSTVWRTGRSDRGALITFHASAEQGDFYLILSYRSTSASMVHGDRKLVRDLLDQLSILPSQ